MGDIWEALEPTFGYGFGDFQVACGVMLAGGHLCHSCWAEISGGEEVAIVTLDTGKDLVFHQRCLPEEYGMGWLTV